MAQNATPKPAKAELKYVSPGELDFDGSNPRLAGQTIRTSQREIQARIFGEPHYASELVDSLLENGFIDYEPLVVRRRNARYVVIEGNRRLAAIRHIRSNFGKYPNRRSDLDKIPVLVFPNQPDNKHKQEVRVYLGVHHLLGFREWPPISKAEYLEHECQMAGGLDKVLKEIPLTKAQVRRFLIPYRLLKKADFILPNKEDFWMVAEGLQRAGIKKFLQLEVDPKSLEIVGFDKKNLKILLNDLYGPMKGGARDASARVVFDTRDLSRLSNVLESEKATSVLHSGKTLEEAEIYVDTQQQSVQRLQRVNKELNTLLKKLSARKKTEEFNRLQNAHKTFEAAVKAFVASEKQ